MYDAAGEIFFATSSLSFLLIDLLVQEKLPIFWQMAPQKMTAAAAEHHKKILAITMFISLNSFKRCILAYACYPRAAYKIASFSDIVIVASWRLF